MRLSAYSVSHRTLFSIQYLALCDVLNTVTRTVRLSEYNSHRTVISIQYFAPCTFLHTVSRTVRFLEYSNSQRAVFQTTMTGKIHEFLTVAHSSINFNTKQLVPQTTVTFYFVHRFNARNLTSATQLSFVQQFIDVEPPVQQSTDVEPPVQQSIDVDLQFSSSSMWNLQFSSASSSTVVVLSDSDLLHSHLNTNLQNSKLPAESRQLARTHQSNPQKRT